jgi:hypothetical protein
VGSFATCTPSGVLDEISLSGAYLRHHKVVVLRCLEQQRLGSASDCVSFTDRIFLAKPSQSSETHYASLETDASSLLLY